jgi:hypothetical protein
VGPPGGKGTINFTAALGKSWAEAGSNPAGAKQLKTKAKTNDFWGCFICFCN